MPPGPDRADYRTLVERMPAIVYVADAGPSGRWHYVNGQIEAVLGYRAEEWLADPGLWQARLHPDDRDRVLAIEVAAQEGTPGVAPAVSAAIAAAAAEYRMLHRDGHVVWVRDDSHLVPDDRGQLRWHGVLSDITARKRVEADAERRAAQQAAVARLGEHALEGADIGSLMNETGAEAARLLDAEISAVLELSADGQELVLRAGAGWDEQAFDTAGVPAQASHSGFALKLGRPVVVDHWDTEERFERPALWREMGTCSGVAVVIEGRDGPFGVLNVQTREPRDFSASDVDFVQSLANVLADALQRQSTEDEIRFQALHDPLTGLPNRVLFLDRIGHALARLDRRGSAMAVLFVDLDNFKLVNDSLGHQAGDELLCGVAPRLTHALRPSDTVARFGGDEFGVLLEDISGAREATQIAERIAAAFARPFLIGETDHFVTASTGIAVADGAGAQAEALIRDADAAMYRAKQRGPARYELFDEVMRATAVGRMRVENELRRAIEREELRVHYQPIVALGDGSVMGVEALLRWEHPERGLVGPAEFIPVAEDSGLIEEIGGWVLDVACRQAVKWQAERPDAAPLAMSVNLSARQASQRELPVIVARVLESTGLQPSSLQLEITETMLLEEVDAPAGTLSALHALGVRLVLDDFGTGYSSLGYLKRLPLDGLKIDRSFVAGLASEEGDRAIVTAVLGMAAALSLGVTAEGVETAEQLAELEALGCRQAQGFYFACAVPAQEIGAILRDGPPWRAHSA